MGSVEREDPGLELGDHRPVVRAGELLRVEPALRSELRRAVVRCHRLDLDHAVGERDRGLDRVGEPLAHVVAHHEPVDYERDVVLVPLVEHDHLVELMQLAVDDDASEALGAQLLEALAVLALAAAHDRRHHHEARPQRQLEDLIDDLLSRLAGDRLAADMAVRDSDPCPQQTQIVIDLGHRANGRPRVARGRLLIDRDRRRQALDRIDVGLVHLAEELTCVGAQRLDVAALALGVDRVERQRGLARARQPRDHRQRVPRQGDVDIAEVVLACPANHDLVMTRHHTQSRQSNRRSCGRPSAPRPSAVRRSPTLVGPKPVPKPAPCGP